jgi:hypothetical protein
MNMTRRGKNESWRFLIVLARIKKFLKTVVLIVILFINKILRSFSGYSDSDCAGDLVCNDGECDWR